MKNKLREHWLAIRQSLPVSRRNEAEEKLLSQVNPLLEDAGFVLSYSCIRDELSTELLNNHLLENNKLVLPLTVDKEIRVYRITNLKTQLSPGRFGILEPVHDKCQRIAPEEITHAIIPGIAFDSENHRLGYGMGYYDRFLFAQGAHINTIGAGFTECYSPTPFPSAGHDISLKRIVLV
jgi:5-formyltetrahydrofolate cyclo-ligase